ncbi:protein phosphatase [Vairimorpha apis BRL 01]|uniref:Protein phosphatase n=1 Tax=Vairimorpha apis BRL 01 TaxID=1037528 RepID=T0MEI5_9MICR|nr:protein phosphatase [Vairimorpha apis BRL 01]EQB61491.1 protein phosphatase [Vairimorpha apis BRL 01]
MEDMDIASLFDDPKLSMDKFEYIIGRDKQKTIDLINYMNFKMPVDENLLHVCALLLLENRNSVIEAIIKILKVNQPLIQTFIKGLQSSNFYNQRMAVPRIIVSLEFDGKKDILKNCFYDKTGLVIKEAVESLHFYDNLPFNDDELLKITIDLNNSMYDFVQCLVPNMLKYVKQCNFLISDICLCKSWRKRLSLVKNLKYFSDEQKNNILNILSKDTEEAVRVALVEEMDHFDEYIDIFINDKSPQVRAATVKKIGLLNENTDVLKKVIDDKSWLVHKELLCIHKEDIYENISLHLIKSLPKSHDWRIKIEILGTINYIVQHNNLLVKRCLLDIFFEYLCDPVCEVRNKASNVFVNLIKEADWSEILLEKFNKLIEMSSYLVRISLAEVCLTFDLKHKTKYVVKMLQDEVFNVKLKMLSVIDKEHLNDEIVKIIENMEEDSYIKKEKDRLFN